MKKVMQVVAALVILLAVFWAGMHFERFRYDDVCVDMGGGRNPGNFPICVIQIP
ncbi:hypothetical protein [Photobacterium halotolerans]|uniref:hypothetical protein n=1 Tax=Photobacterium halotolerans TaxID=265726 RepID=UPI0003F521AE|nr:hypothetical protein [Photobacterium halotolerans]